MVIVTGTEKTECFIPVTSRSLEVDLSAMAAATMSKEDESNKIVVKTHV